MITASKPPGRPILSVVCRRPRAGGTINTVTAGVAPGAGGWDFFISYTGADQAWAEWIAWQAEAVGYRVLVQAWDFVPGTNWIERMHTGLTRATRVIAILSPAYVQSSRFGAAEWQAAWATDPEGRLRRVIPVRVADCEQPGLLAGIVAVDLFDLPEPEAATRLHQAITRAIAGRAKPSTLPPFPASPGSPAPANLAPRPPFPPGLSAIWQVPSRNPNFTGRAGDLATLRAGLSAASTMTVQAVHGMGGVGKTQLVLEYAHRQAAEYDIVWWFEAEQSAAIPDRVSELATALGIPDVTDPEVTRRAVLTELRRRNRWLLIFDNAENVDQVRSLLPSGSGHVLVTTRREGFRAIGGVLDLDLLERADAKALLRHRCPSLTDTDADQLAERLGDLPLALDQAAAYLDRTGLPAREYLDLLGAHPDELLARGQPGGSHHTVATVWSLSIEHLVQAIPAAVALLEICAWLAPEPIPLDLFTAHPEHLAGPLATAAQDQLAFTDTVAALMDYSLVRRTMDALVVHRLVQEVTRSWHAGDTDRSLEPLRVALALLRAALPDDPWWDTASWPIFRKLMPHILAVAASADHHAIDMEALARMLSTSGTYQRRMGRFDEALTMHKGALAIHSADTSPASPAVVADDLDDVGRDTRGLGRYRDALRVFECARNIRQAAYGSEFPGLAQDLNGLGWARIDLGQYEEALLLHQRALAIREASPGPAQLDVADNLDGVGWAFTRLARHTEALTVFERALAIREAALGPDHPDVADNLDAVGWSLHHQARPAEALETFKRALAIHENSLGLCSPKVADDLQGIGWTLVKLNQYERARSAFERTRNIREAAFGPHHPDLAHDIDAIGFVLQHLGQPADALPRHRQALTMLEETLGPDHPALVNALDHVEWALDALGQTDEAQSYHRRAEAIRKKSEASLNRDADHGLDTTGA